MIQYQLYNKQWYQNYIQLNIIKIVKMIDKLMK